MKVLHRRRLRWNRDLLVVAELGPPVATSPTESTAIYQVVATQVVHHRRRWGRVR